MASTGSRPIPRHLLCHTVIHNSYDNSIRDEYDNRVPGNDSTTLKFVRLEPVDRVFFSAIRNQESRLTALLFYDLKHSLPSNIQNKFKELDWITFPLANNRSYRIARITYSQGHRGLHHLEIGLV